MIKKEKLLVGTKRCADCGNDDDHTMYFEELPTKIFCEECEKEKHLISWQEADRYEGEPLEEAREYYDLPDDVEVVIDGCFLIAQDKELDEEEALTKFEEAHDRLLASVRHKQIRHKKMQDHFKETGYNPRFDWKLVDKEGSQYRFYDPRHKIKVDLCADYEEEAWMKLDRPEIEKYRLQPDNHLLVELPEGLQQRISRCLRRSQNLSKQQMVISALEAKCRGLEAEIKKEELKVRRRRCLLVKDPDTGIYRRFPEDWNFGDHQVIEGTYYPGWKSVSTGFFEADAADETPEEAYWTPFIKIEDDKAVGEWNLHPFGFFDHGWTYAEIEEDGGILVEVTGRRKDDGELVWDIYLENELVAKAYSAEKAHELYLKQV